jgi:hypothetical protein
MMTPERRAELGDREWWEYMSYAYSYGLIDPQPGSAEEEAFLHFAEYTRKETERVYREREEDREYARQQAARRPELASAQPAPPREPEADREAEPW